VLQIPLVFGLNDNLRKQFFRSLLVGFHKLVGHKLEKQKRLGALKRAKWQKKEEMENVVNFLIISL